MKCKKCGEIIENKSLCCIHCGAKLKKKKWLLPLIIGVVVCIAAAIGLAFLTGNDVSGDYEKQIELGYKYIGEGNYEEAIIAFDKAIEIDEKKSKAYYGKAEAMAHDPEMTMEKAEEIIAVLEEGYEKSGDKGLSEHVVVIADIVEGNGFSDEAEYILNYDILGQEIKYLDLYYPILENYYTASQNDFYDGDGDVLESMGVNDICALVNMELNLHYALHDVNGDSVPELFIASVGDDFVRQEDGLASANYNIYDIYTIIDDETVRPFDIYSMGYRAIYYICEDGIIACAGSSGAFYSSVKFDKITPEGKVENVCEFIRGYNEKDNIPEYYVCENGVESDISKGEYDNAYYIYPLDKNIIWEKLDDYKKLKPEEEKAEASGNSVDSQTTVRNAYKERLSEREFDGFSLYDIDKDGTEELIIYSGGINDTSMIPIASYECDIYTYKDDSVVYVGNCHTSDCFYGNDEPGIWNYLCTGTHREEFNLVKINDGKIENTEVYLIKLVSIEDVGKTVKYYCNDIISDEEYEEYRDALEKIEIMHDFSAI